MKWLSALRARYRVTEDPLRTVRRIELAALLLGLLLCLQLVYGGFSLATLAPPAAVEPAADSLQVPAVRGPVVLAAGDRNEIITRPLFWSSRRPVSEVATLADARGKSGELKDVKLVGVFGSGKQAGVIALVKDKKQRILVGESLEGWTLESIQGGETVFSSGARRESLKLERGSVTQSSGNAKKAPLAGAGNPAHSYAPPPPPPPPPSTAKAASQGQPPAAAAGGVQANPTPGPAADADEGEPRTLSLGPGG